MRPPHAQLAPFRILLAPLVEQWDEHGRLVVDSAGRPFLNLAQLVVYTPTVHADGNPSPYILEDGSWGGHDVILKQQGGHFTVLSKPADWDELQGSLIDRFVMLMRQECSRPVVERQARVNPSLSIYALAPRGPRP